MRNDVKLGFAIGAVLLTVLIVYVLVVPGGNTRQTKLDNAARPDGKVTLEPTTRATAPPAAPPGSFTPPNPLNEVVTELAKADDQVPEPPPPAKTRDIDWNKLLNGQPVLMSTPASDMQTPQGGEGRSLTPPTPGRVPPLEPERSSVARDRTADEPSALDPAVERFDVRRATHVIQARETLSSISAAAYGDPNYWPAIVKANPGIDPDRLKLGTTIKLPDLKDIRTADSQNASAHANPSAQHAIDMSKQYRVQSGDNLHNISIKLYGKSTLADKIYQLNKQTIGNDPAKLKIGQILQLPEPPTVTASR